MAKNHTWSHLLPRKYRQTTKCQGETISLSTTVANLITVLRLSLKEGAALRHCRLLFHGGGIVYSVFFEEERGVRNWSDHLRRLTHFLAWHARILTATEIRSVAWREKQDGFFNREVLLY